jgi:hypothetical protein
MTCRWLKVRFKGYKIKDLFIQRYVLYWVKIYVKENKIKIKI